MKRFHAHVAVKDLAESVRFYSALFDAAPAVLREDYANWMLEDPRINFAISTHGHENGLNHLGFQVESHAELTEMRSRLERPDMSLVAQTGQACCYAKSDKYWVTDPQGVAWETFHTLAAIPVFGETATRQPGTDACCVRLAAPSEKGTAACCVPAAANNAEPCCTA